MIPNPARSLVQQLLQNATKLFVPDVLSNEVELQKVCASFVTEQKRFILALSKWKPQKIDPRCARNIYTQPPGVLSTVKSLFGQIKWNADSSIYATDFLTNFNRKSIFSRKFFNSAWVLNPPYAEEDLSSVSPRGKESRPLEAHIRHILKLSRKSQIPQAILLPVRRKKQWFKDLLEFDDVATIFFRRKICFFREGKKLGPAPFLSFVALVGFSKQTLQVDNNNSGFLI